MLADGDGVADALITAGGDDVVVVKPLSARTVSGAVAPA